MRRSTRIITLLTTLLVVCILTFFALTPSPSFSATPQFEMEAIPLVISGTLGTITTIIPMDDGNLMVATQQGAIYNLIRPSEPDGTWVANFYYTVAGRLTYYIEAGLLDIEPAPDYPATPHLYFSYVNQDNELIIERFNTETAQYSTILSIPPLDEKDPYHHYAGALEFYDGLLYITVGDRWLRFPEVPGHPSQQLDNLYGKVLRIDVATEGRATYRIPPDNPYVGLPGARGKSGLMATVTPGR